MLLLRIVCKALLLIVLSSIIDGIAAAATAIVTIATIVVAVSTGYGDSAFIHPILDFVRKYRSDLASY